MSERRLTVSRLWRPKPGRYPGVCEPEDFVPFVRLSGRWLEELGFEPGGRLRVAAQPGRLVITALGSAGREP